MPKFDIVLIGAGNVATQLGLALLKKHKIIQIFSKHELPAKDLAKKLNCNFTTSLKQVNPNADIYVIAVSDDAIEEVSGKLKVGNKIVVHTSGSVAMESLKKNTNNYGVFYPLQTFSKEKKIDFKKIPICLEANNSKTYKLIESIALDISNYVQQLNSKQRAYLHLAAVFACNFTNYFYSIADKLLKDNNLSLDLLKPLIEETAIKIKKHSPTTVQTGPAIRKDKKTIKKHLNMLEGSNKELYKLLSKKIAE